MAIKKILFTIALLILSVSIYAKSDELKPDHKLNIVEKLERIYDDLCDYEKADYIELFGDNSIGKLIKNRLWLPFALLLIIKTAFQTIKVLADPDTEQFPKHMFFKPLMIVLFMAFYPSLMAGVNTVMEYLTFKDIARTSVMIVEKNKNMVYENEFRHGIGNFDDQYMRMPWEPENETFSVGEVSSRQAMMDPALLQKNIELVDALNKKKKLSEKDLKQIYQSAEKSISGAWSVKQFQRFSYWAGDKVSTMMRIIQTVLLSILFIGGPIAITLDQIFEGSMKKWFSIFIHTHLWTPCIFLVDVVSAKISAELNSMAQEGSTYILVLIIQLVIIAMYLTIAKVASNFIQSQEGGGVLSAMSYTVWKNAMSGYKKLSGGAGGLSGAAKAFGGTLKPGGNA